eukprot:4720338-Prorocentrum_lima.AAC.1
MECRCQGSGSGCPEEFHTDYVVTTLPELNAEEEVYDVMKAWNGHMYFYKKGLLVDPRYTFGHTVHT